MYNKIRESIIRNITNGLGKKNERKIIIFESDDWGTIRVSSKKSYEELLKKGYPVDQCVYNSNDTLEDNSDIECLYEALNAVKDKNGNTAIFTMNNIVANPDFEKIRESEFEEYYFEPFTETLKKYPNHDRVMALYNEGIDKKLIKPQFHGREHVHVTHWMNSLLDGDKSSHDLFKNKMFTVFKGKKSNCRNEFLDAMGTYNSSQLEFLSESIQQGLKLFKKIWGYHSKTLIPPCYIWHPEAETFFKKSNIEVIQTSRIQFSPLNDSEKYKLIRRYTGGKNKKKLTYTVRNVTFEPSMDRNYDWVNSSMKEISNAFFWNNPAIISSHRVNYVGLRNKRNRDNNIKLLIKLIKTVKEKWPEVEFMSSDDFVKIIKN